MVSLLATAGALTVALSLLGAAAGHLRRPAALATALRGHGVLPSRLVPLVAAAVIGVEALLGGAVALGMATGWRRTAVALGAATALFVAYAAYAGYLLLAGRAGVPCGCAGSRVPLTGWVAARAAALAAAALAGWAFAPSALDPALRGDVVVAMCAGGTFACLLALLPAAMTDPAPATGGAW